MTLTVSLSAGLILIIKALLKDKLTPGQLQKFEDVFLYCCKKVFIQQEKEKC